MLEIYETRCIPVTALALGVKFTDSQKKIAIVKPQHENVHDKYSDAEMKESQNNVLAQIQQKHIHAALNAKNVNLL